MTKSNYKLAVFPDACFLIALLSRTDKHYRLAQATFDVLNTIPDFVFIVNNLVIAETISKLITDKGITATVAAGQLDRLFINQCTNGVRFLNFGGGPRALVGLFRKNASKRIVHLQSNDCLNMIDYLQASATFEISPSNVFFITADKGIANTMKNTKERSGIILLQDEVDYKRLLKKAHALLID